MNYTHSEYRREHEDRDNKQGGWRSWFGLGDNKDRDEDYKWSNTTTYRTNPTYYGPENRPYGPTSAPWTGPRGGYGYTTTSDDYTPRPSWMNSPSWNTDRDYNTRYGYGTTGDRDVYYKGETRTYGGDNWTPRRDTYTPSRPTGDYNTPTTRPFDDYTCTPSRQPCGPTGEYRPFGMTPRPVGYGFSGERDTTMPSRYTTDRYNTEYRTPSRFPVTGERDYYPTSDRWTTDRDYPTSRSYGYDSRTYPTTTYPSTYRY